MGNIRHVTRDDMRHDSLRRFVRDARGALARGPVALILAEDAVELDSTIRHHLGLGFRTLAVFVRPEAEIAPDLARRVHRVDHDPLADGSPGPVVNAVLPAARGQWVHYAYNAEYLFYPFCEHRSVGELTRFVAGERRDTVLCYVVDLYAGDLGAHPSGVSRQDAHLDRAGYYALARKDRAGRPLERQLDFFGGLRWRFEEHVPPDRRRIDRTALVRAVPGLRLRDDHTATLPEHNTYACPWHHSVTAAICSFRTAKALKRNPGSTYDIATFRWHNSEPFRWEAQQLLDLGLMEPGQWF